MNGIGALLATFLAAGVEWVEALTIVVAVGVTRGWRSSLSGAGAALALLLVLVAVIALVASGLGHLLPLALARTLVGVFLLLFGIRWLHKAVLRSAGLRSLHDEEKAFAEARAQLQGDGSTMTWAGFATAFGGTFLEGLEVVFIVVALAGLGGFLPAAGGAVLALAVVAAGGAALQRPLSLVPENTMKYVVGVMLSSFGTFFVGEGLGVQWWHADLSLLPLIAGYLVCSLLIVLALRYPISGGGVPGMRWIGAALSEIWGLFVGEGPLAPLTIAVLLGVGLLVARLPGTASWAGVLLGAGVVVALLLGLGSAFGEARKKSAARREAATAEPAPGESSEVPEPAGR
ncbi:MAG: hypothetical protein WAM30_10035 [Candidatus Dormiibacterota bacterium]